MPKIIELTVEIDIQRVSCPGVWLCQDGRVCLTVFALGTSYQTCLLPPIFPLLFKDVFYFKKRFQDACALHNICCLLKNETIYCELVQWCGDCVNGEYVILAQYLGALSDVLFPPNMCSSDGVDLLMRRSKDFPGILSPKIEIATKVRIDEMWDQSPGLSSAVKLTACSCAPHEEDTRQKQVCHSARYHRYKCNSQRPRSRSRSRSHSGSVGSSSFTSPSVGRRPCPGRTRAACREYCVYNVHTYPSQQGRTPWPSFEDEEHSDEDISRCNDEAPFYVTDQTEMLSMNEDRMQKLILESRYIDHEKYKSPISKEKFKRCHHKSKVTPCVCEICKRYHELFHTKHV